MFHQVGYNDAVLLGCIGYTCVDLLLDWDSFSTCSKPVHVWLFTSCACAFGFRVMRMLGSWACSAAASTTAAGGGGRPIGGNIGECLLDIGHKVLLPKAVMIFTWAIFVPFFALWNFQGTMWLWEVMNNTPQCIPTDTHAWFSVVWLFLTYLWLVVHIGLAVQALRLKRRVRRVEANLREVEDSETIERWGPMSSTGARSLMDSWKGGLSPASIKALPIEVVPASGLNCINQLDCSICLSDLEPGETMRCLPGCGHRFHRSCIDLWLVRQAECPLCKQAVEEMAES